MAKEVGSWVCMSKADYTKLKKAKSSVSGTKRKKTAKRKTAKRR